ncbi:hypothetical protein [Brasilonema sp. UFV-L1]|uniref:hypothetical protein n=1 Tax=Brasilonema sp. UFV-L1 TaxID=2234130 RepID=UPI00145DB923|nr:hypothetical protein [Brasilonema sp. UFV-L1]NMG06611.1 hypothetical protein [Brasilonema sp. UFV-L1]
MSQNANTYLILPEQSEEFIASEPWSIETCADGLMDELFTEINLILDGCDSLPSQASPPQKDIRQVQTVTIPQIIVPETQIQPRQKVPTSVPKARNNPLNQVGVQTSAASKPKNKPRKKSKRTKGLVLWMGVSIGLMAASILWVLNSVLVNRLVSKSFQQSLLQPQTKQIKPQSLTKSQVETDLANYMLGALAVIDKQEARSYIQRSAKPVYTATPAHQAVLAYITPQPTTAGRPSADDRNSTTVTEQHIKVYQAPQPMRYTSSPEVIVSKDTFLNASQPAPVDTNLNSVTPPKQATVTALTPGEQEVASTETTYKISAFNYKLERLLELGNKSAALFKVNGVTQRVELGEVIGSSGWTLVEFANGKAIIRRNGEVRSIYTGQTF